MKIVSRSNLLGVVVGSAVVYGHVVSAYRKWWGYDNLMHLLGGAALGSIIASRESRVLQDVAIVTGLGVVWELVEYDHGVNPWDGSGDVDSAAEDTVLDMLLVIVGAVATSLLAKD